MNKTIPAISIIIPMYNAGKFIGECLDSILAQTLDDYEVIVVDDCSKDNSAAIVESYIPKFTAEKLRLVRSKINSGGASTPRNIGFKFAVGKYVFFMDADDAVMPDALAELYAAAEKFGADIAHFDKNYKAPGETVTTDRNFLQEFTYLNVDDSLIEPTLIDESVTERVQRLLNRQFRWEPWTHLIRRDLLLENDLKFSNLSIADDFLFSTRLIFVAEKIALLPDAYYVWRTHANSNCREFLPPEKRVHRRAGDAFRAIEILDKFMDGFENFADNRQNKYAVFDFFVIYGGFQEMLELYEKMPAALLDELVRAELREIGDITALAAYLFSRMSVFHVNLRQYQQLLQQQQQQIQQLQAKF